MPSLTPKPGYQQGHNQSDLLPLENFLDGMVCDENMLLYIIQMQQTWWKAPPELIARIQGRN